MKTISVSKYIADLHEKLANCTDEEIVALCRERGIPAKLTKTPK